MHVPRPQSKHMFATRKSRRRQRRRERERRRGGLFLHRLSVLWIIGLTLVAFSRFFGSWAYAIDIVANVSHAISPVALLSACIFALFRRRGRTIICIAIMTVAMWPLLGGYVYQANSPPANETTTNTVTIMVVNVRGQNDSLVRLSALIAEHDPDCVAVIEAGHDSAPTLLNREDIINRYPYRVAPDASILYSTALLSRYPLFEIECEDDPSSQVDDTLYAFHHSYLVDAPNGRFVWTAAHPPSPRTSQSWARGNEKVAALGDLIQSQLIPLQRPVVVAGDFNSTITGYRHRLMATRSHLAPSDAMQPSLIGTWPSRWPGWSRLSLDRLWVSPENINVVKRKVLPDIGSDHRPVLFTCEMK